MRVARRGVSEDVEVTAAWAPVQTLDDVEGWTAAKAKIDAGVPAR